MPAFSSNAVARLATLTGLVLAAGLASAQTDDREALGQFRDWTAVAYTDSTGTRTCMMWSEPQRSSGEYTDRGEPFIFVTYRPAVAEVGKFSIEAGYEFGDGAGAEVLVRGESFPLATIGSTGASSEPDLLKAMSAGVTMDVIGVSARGTKTEDRYSLLGFTAAWRAIDQACPQG